VKKHEIKILITLALVQFTHVMDSMVMMPLGPNLKASFHIDSPQFNALVGSYGIAAFFSAIAATFWLDKFDRKSVLRILYIGFLFGTLSCAISPNYETLLASRIFTGLFGGVAGAVILSIVGDIIPIERRARGMGILMSGFALAAVAGVPAGIWLSETFSWHTPFYLIVAIGILVLFAIQFLVPSVKEHLNIQNKENISLYSSVFNSANQLRALLFSFTYILAHFAIIPNLSDYLVTNLHFNMKTELVWMYIIGGILSSVTSPLWGKLADKFGKFKVFMVLSILSFFPIFLISNFQSKSLLLLLPVTCMFFIFSGGRMIPASALLTSAVPPQLRGGFMSLNSALQQLAVGLMGLTGGFIIINDKITHELHNYSMLGYLGIIFTIVSILVGIGVKVFSPEGNQKA
jgi:DHA1 family inner membrane transport protein